MSCKPLCAVVCGLFFIAAAPATKPVAKSTALLDVVLADVNAMPQAYWHPATDVASVAKSQWMRNYVDLRIAANKDRKMTVNGDLARVSAGGTASVDVLVVFGKHDVWGEPALVKAAIRLDNVTIAEAATWQIGKSLSLVNVVQDNIEWPTNSGTLTIFAHGHLVKQ